MALQILAVVLFFAYFYILINWAIGFLDSQIHRKQN
jgi:hypothetical protein